tara:strand:- start:5597 stop:5803 length:207 start_codon:yes stop_codon:yes gene_type:complete
MDNSSLEFIFIITLSLIFGFVLGALVAFIYTKFQVMALEKEVDKFRDLYFDEMDKWSTKYEDENYKPY